MPNYLQGDVDVASLQEHADECETSCGTKLALISLISGWQVLVRHGQSHVPGDFDHKYDGIGGTQFQVCPFCDVALGAMLRKDGRGVKHHEYCPWLNMDNAVRLVAQELSKL